MVSECHGDFRILGSLFTFKQLQSGNPRLVQIHAGILIGGDAFESGIHEAHELEAGEGFAWVAERVYFFSGFA